MRIVIIDDDKDIGEILEISLRNEGYEVIVFSNSLEAMAYLMQNNYDLIIADIMMPQFTGYELCHQLRKTNDVPIIFITCLDDDESLTRALALGGDDFIRKPFSLAEVLARVRAHLRRYASRIVSEGAKIHYRLGPYTYNAQERVVEENAVIVRLSPLENDLLRYFADHPNELLTYKVIYEDIWKEPYNNDKATIMVRVSSLRSKLERLEIESVRGKGYRLIAGLDGCS